MRVPKFYGPASIFLLAAVVLSGCGKAGSQFSPPAGSTPMAAENGHHGGAHPANCTPTLWASSLSTGRVNGYLAANSAPCVSLHGSYAGLHFQQPYAVAIGSNPNYLYVADLLNDRIVVFDAQGNYVKWLNTKLGNTDYNPWGVCVSPQGVVGVGNIQQGAAQGIVEFFAPTAPSGSLPTGDATGQLQRQTYCAFDSAGNFFVEDGTSSGTSHIDYLASANVGLPGQTLVDAGLGSGSTWVGMYSRIDSPAGDTLSVASNTPNNAAQLVQTWTVSGPPAGPLTLTPCTCSPYHFHQFPHNTGNIVDGVAPTTGGSGGFLYFADYGKGRILQGPANGGVVTTYETLHGALGVATNPGGQY
ncbi:MAG: hypothetical protein WCD38_12935 [Candidatus Tumulicola sp.]